MLGRSEPYIILYILRIEGTPIVGNRFFFVVDVARYGGIVPDNSTRSICYHNRPNEYVECFTPPL